MEKSKLETTGQTVIRECRSCGLVASCTEDLKLFVKRTELKSGYQNLCKKCHREKYKKSLDWVKSKYGISKEDYKKAMNTSDKCQICSTTDELCYDHDHNTGEFRGVLCRKCNRAIGQLGDTLSSLHKAYMYLVQHYTLKD